MFFSAELSGKEEKLLHPNGKFDKDENPLFIDLITPMKEILPNLFIGNGEANEIIFSQMKRKTSAFSAILDCRSSSDLPKHDPHYLHISLSDGVSPDITIENFKEGIAFIQQSVQTSRILVNCDAGSSRSVSMVIAYIIAIHLKDDISKLSSEELVHKAYMMIKEKRQCADIDTHGQRIPLEFFANQLKNEMSHNNVDNVEKEEKEKECDTVMLEEFAESKPTDNSRSLYGLSIFSHSPPPSQKQSLFHNSKTNRVFFIKSFSGKTLIFDIEMSDKDAKENPILPILFEFLKARDINFTGIDFMCNGKILNAKTTFSDISKSSGCTHIIRLKLPKVELYNDFGSQEKWLNDIRKLYELIQSQVKRKIAACSFLSSVIGHIISGSADEMLKTDEPENFGFPGEVHRVIISFINDGRHCLVRKAKVLEIIDEESLRKIKGQLNTHNLGCFKIIWLKDMKSLYELILSQAGKKEAACSYFSTLISRISAGAYDSEIVENSSGFRIFSDEVLGIVISFIDQHRYLVDDAFDIMGEKYLLEMKGQLRANDLSCFANIDENANHSESGEKDLPRLGGRAF